MNRKGWILIASLAFAGTAHAQPQSCETRLQAIGLSATTLRPGQIIHLDGQTVTVADHEPAQKICDRVDQINDPIKSRDQTIKSLTARLTEMTVNRNGLRDYINNTNWFKRNYILGWFGWAVFWSYLLFMCGRWSKSGRANSHGKIFSQ